MAWNPDTYNQFKTERFAPFYDLLSLVNIKQGMDTIDLGCGTGELTKKLADYLPGAKLIGIDSSMEMLDQSKAFADERIQFIHRSIEEQLNMETKWDLVFSNAAIQWVDNHTKLLTDLIGCLKTSGQLLIQVPAQHHNLTNQLLIDLAAEEPFTSAFNHWNPVSPVLDIESYAQLLFENGSKEMTVFEKIYPLILTDTNALYNWVSGTALIPFTEKLPQGDREQFIEEYKKRLQNRFSKTPVFYAFKRIIIAANF